MATKFHFNEHNTAKRNSSIALNTAKSLWKNFSESDQKTWKDHSPFNSNNTIKDPDGQLHFLHLMMKRFALSSSNTRALMSIQLSNGQGNDYSQQSSWNWTVS